MTFAALPGGPLPHDAPQLAAYLADNEMPGARTAQEIRTLRTQRAAHRVTAPARPSLAERVTAALLARARAEITRHGGEIAIPGRTTTSPLEVWDRQPEQRLTLLGARGPRHYPTAHGDRPSALAYLYGQDATGEWVARVPPAIITAAEALAWLEPAAVHEARGRGRRVERLGQVYAIETTSQHDTTGALPPAYHWHSDSRTMTYEAPGRGIHYLHLPWPARFVQQRVYAPSRRSPRR
jgi:hypothetical protein